MFLRHQSFKLNQQPVTRRSARVRRHSRVVREPCLCICMCVRFYVYVNVLRHMNIYVRVFIYTYGCACVCVYLCARARVCENARPTEYWSKRALCDESVLIITLVRETSRDAFADTYDKLSVYQQISFPNPAIFPLVCPRLCFTSSYETHMLFFLFLVWY